MITGGRGFTGQHIVERLCAGGRRVVVYDRGVGTQANGVRMVQGELFDIPRLVRVLAEQGIRQIVHTAGLSHPTLSLDVPVATFEANVPGTVSLFEAARLAGVRRVVNFSTRNTGRIR